ncbi:MAG TPA: sigma-70 family RNA polymerase sigma factor [Marmoricola sp.]|nr:sigma-70 family RNA polymerase sigma factor [Marmoricola sp.]
MEATAQDALASEFEGHRSRLRAVAYRMLGSVSETDDVVQEAWLRLSRSDTSAIANLGAWLTTVVSRLCLDHLRARRAQPEDSLESRFPDPVLTDAAPDPEEQAFLAESVGLAMLVVLDQLGPAERLAFVLHDLFGLPFAEIAAIVERTPDATKMLASRARRRVQGARVVPDPDLAKQRIAVDAFQAAAREGDFEALLRVLDPDVVLRNASAEGLRVVSGAAAVASGAVTFQQMALAARPVVVNGTAAVAAVRDGVTYSIAAFTVVDGRIVAIDILTDPERLRRLFPEG